MKYCKLLAFIFLSIQQCGFAQKIIVAPGTVSSTSATLVWSNDGGSMEKNRYHVFLNGKEIATVAHCNYRLSGLQPSTQYKCLVSQENNNARLPIKALSISFKTAPPQKILDVTAFGAVGNGSTLNTIAIQKAIDACPAGGKVRIPAGVFVSGALFLKSHMTLEIAKGGVLKGSVNDADYLPLIKNRFEGWEMETYASLLNAGQMNHNGGYAVQQLSICGEGTISGGGDTLGKAMIAKKGLRGRGRLICLMNCKDVEIQGLTINNSPCWTIHYIYSKGISCHDLDITSTLLNGDGIDPDSSDDSYIFNCTFSTGDDCIAIKSGKNPEGYTIGKPTTNVQVTNCNFVRGHGISIGSEMSGGVSNVLVQDCKAGALLYGMQIKGTQKRGGYVRDVKVTDCQLMKITVFSELGYNNDGEAAPVTPIFERFVFKNIDLSKADIKRPVMDLNGFKDAGHRLKDVLLENIIVPENSRIVIKDAENIKFVNVSAANGQKPNYELTGTDRILF